jgi:hypothetical protein
MDSKMSIFAKLFWKNYSFVLPNFVTDLGVKCPHNLSLFPPSLELFEKNNKVLFWSK